MLYPSVKTCQQIIKTQNDLLAVNNKIGFNTAGHLVSESYTVFMQTSGDNDTKSRLIDPGCRSRIFLRIILAVSFTLILMSCDISNDITSFAGSAQSGNDRVTRRIGVIGDSWVADGRFDPFLATACSEINLPVKIFSNGIKGADSKRVRKELIGKQPGSNQPSGILSVPEIRTIIVVAGVNDVLEHRGAAYYADNIFSIARLLSGMGITTLILEIPRFGLNVEPRLSRVEFLRRRIRRWLKEKSSDDQIGCYRLKLRNELEKNRLGGVLLINPDTVIPDYRVSSSLYSNPYHLNEEGNRLLAAVVAHTLAETLPDIREVYGD